LHPLHLTLFFTGGLSLKSWAENGILDREIALYRRLQDRGVIVTFVTYGDASDLAYADRIPGIRVLCNRWGMPSESYRRWLPFLHSPYLMNESVLKTNQTPGADRALLASKYLHKKLIVRCGYLPSENMLRFYGSTSPQAQQAIRLELKVFTDASQVVVTTLLLKQIIVERYKIVPEKITVIPNYVDVDVFRPEPDCQRIPNRICFIGRLDEGKNLSALIKALSGQDLELLVIGDGKLRDELIDKAIDEQVPATFLGNLPNKLLPGYINSSALFILPSLIEGHPKVLIEAMACGVPVIGSNVQGIREIINHRETGLLCGTSPAEIQAAIRAVMVDPQLRERMGRQARQYVLDHFSLERVLEQELAMLQSVSGHNAG
jgi:glycosyltransferase involved in cell wall biosynthesis